MHRYRAPKHISEIFTSTGPKVVSRGGLVLLEDDAPLSDHQELLGVGCYLEPADPVSPAPRKPKKGAKSKSSPPAAQEPELPPPPVEPEAGSDEEPELPPQA